MHAPLLAAGKPPLYFQHEGHSRTIVGVERVEGRGNAPPSVHLLVLDPLPGHRAARARPAQEERLAGAAVALVNLEVLPRSSCAVLSAHPRIGAAAFVEEKVLSSGVRVGASRASFNDGGFFCGGRGSSSAAWACCKSRSTRLGWLLILNFAMGQLCDFKHVTLTRQSSGFTCCAPQLLFCEDGLASGQELAELKIMRTTQNFGF